MMKFAGLVAAAVGQDVMQLACTIDTENQMASMQVTTNGDAKSYLMDNVDVYNLAWSSRCVQELDSSIVRKCTMSPTYVGTDKDPQAPGSDFDGLVNGYQVGA